MSEQIAKNSLQQQSLENSEAFWISQANRIIWTKPWTQLLDSSNKPFYQWFAGGEANVCYNVLDKHVVNGYGQQVAAIYESSATGFSGKVTYNELLHQVSKFAGVLKNLNVNKEDVVFIFMPNIFELTIAMLATWRIGGIMSTHLPNATSHSLAERIQMSKPKIFITSNATRINCKLVCFKKLLDEALHKLNYHAKVIVFQRPEFEPVAIDPNQDIIWEDEMKCAHIAECVPVASNQTVMIACSSGTSGKSKGIAYNAVGFLTVLCNDIVFKSDSTLQPEMVVFSPSHPGWMSGIRGSFVPMFSRKCCVIYDGDVAGNGDVDTLYRIMSKHKVASIFFNVATLRELSLADPRGARAKKYDLSSITAVLTGAEVLHTSTLNWAESVFLVSVLELWGQTEGINATEDIQILENKELGYTDRHAKFPRPGFILKIFNEDGEELPAGEIGFIAAKLPIPPCTLATLYRDDDLFFQEYLSSFPGYFNTKDLGWMNNNGGLHIAGRGDDLMKVSGVSLTTIQAECAILQNPDIAECTVVPLKHKEMYQVPVAFYILKDGAQIDRSKTLKKMKKHFEEFFGPAVIFNYALPVKHIPKTVTGKISRKVIQSELQKLIKEVSHYDDPDILTLKIQGAAASLGLL